MGNELTEGRAEAQVKCGDDGLRAVPWLDVQSADLVRAIARALALHHLEVYAVILFGSIARHDERPLSDSEPSDVDILLLIQHPLPEECALAIIHTIGETSHALGYAPRDVPPLLVERDLSGWDPLFVANIARDGILLWARGPLPASLAPVAERASGSAAS